MIGRFWMFVAAAVVLTVRQDEPLEGELCPSFKTKVAADACSSYRASLAGATKAYWDIVAAREKSYSDALGAALESPLVAADPLETATIQEVRAAIAMRLETHEATPSIPLNPPKETPTQVTWRAGDPSMKLIRTNEGICFLSGIGGNLEGGGESVNIVIRDGWWILEGTSHQESLWATATCVRFKK